MRTGTRRFLSTTVGVFMLATLLPLAAPLPAFADTTAQTLPFSQDWTNIGLITTSDSWSGVPGIVGYRGDALVAATGVDPQTVTADGSATPVDVNATNTTPNTFTTGGVTEFEITDPVVALQGSGTADAPHLVIALVTTGLSGIHVAYSLRDVDGSADNAVQPIALQFRTGGSGSYTNVPAAFVADASTGPSLATLVTPVSVNLPAAADNQALLELRVITTDAAGSDEWIGIDDISITVSGDPSGVGAAAPSTVQQGDTSLLTVAVTPGINPASTGLAVVGDLTSIGGSATQTFYDDGATGGDVSAGDSVFTFEATVAPATTPGAKTLPTTISDAQLRTGSADISLTVTETPPPAGSVLISEVYGGGGNSGATLTNDFIELYNPEASPISLAGWSVQYASAAGITWQVTNLTGSIPAGKNYLVQEAAGAGGSVPLPTPDAIGSIPMSATAGKVALVFGTSALSGSCPTGASIIDFVGYGTTANCFEGSGPTPAPSNSTSVSRIGGGATDTNNNAADFVAGAPDPHATDAAPTVTATSPLDGATGVLNGSNIDITFSEAVSATGAWFTTSCGSSGPHSAEVSGGPTTFTLNPDSDFVDLETCTVTVIAAQVTDQDTDDPPDNMAANYVFSFTTEGDVCTLPHTSIHDIQGPTGDVAVPFSVSTEGVVVGDFEGPTSSGIQGFYIEEPSPDADPMTSEGIFVLTGDNASVVNAGDLVRVTGTARERFNQTSITGTTVATPVTSIVLCSTGNSVTPTEVTLPVTVTSDFEKYEGMLVNFTQSLVISEYFNYARFGEIVLALPLTGETRPFTGTSIDAPGAPALGRAAANALRRITLDDGLGSQNPAVLRHPNGDPFALDNYFRGGDTVANTVGVLGYDFGLYRIQPTGPADYTVVNPRPSAAPDPGGRLHVAAQNTLNFFLTLDDGSNSGCGPTFVLGCRGANTAAEFNRQRDKLLNTLVGLDADVIGLNELENTTGVEPIGDPADGILAGLDAMLGAGTYDYIDTGTIGTDAIRVGLIYKPASVTPVGAFQILDSTVDPRFIDTKSRPVLAQTFMENSTGELFTVAVNHLKSKGSNCNDVGDFDAGDGQGNCNGTRTAAAQALVDWLATDPTGSGDPDFLIVGDLNSYAMEDPITAIKAGSDDAAGTSDDYTNLIAHFSGPFAYSYVFDGQAGYLDHALSSTSLTGQVTGAAEWHINSDEASVLDYDMTFKPPEQEDLYETAAYRSSDHDSVLVGLNLQTAQLALGGAGCSEFADGTSAGLGELRYSVNKGKLNGINQGSFSYWVEVQAAAGANSFTINQAITSGNFTTLFGITNGSNVFRWDCQSGLSSTISQSSLNASSGTVTVAFNAPVAGTYYIGVKFSTASVKGKPAPNPTTVHYDFWTAGVDPSQHGVDLVKQ